MRVYKRVLIVLFAVSVVSCSSDQEIKIYSVSYAFTDSAAGWEGDFADYPADSTGYHLLFEYGTLPYNINSDSSRFSLKLSGINLNNSGLFMFIKRQVSGLKPNQRYQVLFNLRVASNNPTGETEEGEYPGDNVFIKVGATEWEPEKELVDNVYVMNLDKGDGEEEGANMVTIGDIGVSSGTTDYTIIKRNNDSTNGVVANTDERGSLWVIVGTDSEYPGETTLYYTQLEVLFNQLD